MDHRCRRGEYCADHEETDNTRVGRQIEKPDGLCDACTRHVERTIAELPVDYVTLNTILGKGATVGGEPVRMTNHVFDRLEEAEWHVFKLRWKKYTGRDLPD